MCDNTKLNQLNQRYQSLDWIDMVVSVLRDTLEVLDAYKGMDRLREQNRVLAQYVVGMWDQQLWMESDALQDIGERLGLVELRQVEPGSCDAEEWGEDAELYYLKDWVRKVAEED